MTAAVEADPLLALGYRRCAELTRKFGTTYYWGAAILARPNRAQVHAVYALCRLADDIVDDQQANQSRTPLEIADRLEAFAAEFRAALAMGGSSDPVMAAVVDTVLTADIDPACFDRFFAAMAMDLTTTTYEIHPAVGVARLGCGHRRNDAAGAATADAGGQGAGQGSGLCVPVDQFPP